MIKKLEPVGAGLGLVLEPSMLSSMGINQNTPLEVTIDGRTMIVRPISLDHEDRVLEAAEAVMTIHDETLKRLYPAG